MSVTTQQHFQSLQGKTVYIVDPDLIRRKLILNSLQVSAKKVEERNLLPAKSESVPTPEVRKKKKTQKRKAVLEIDDQHEEEDDSGLPKVSSKEVTTRAGRVSKPKLLPGITPRPPSSKPTESSTPPGEKVRKREPASVFRCPTCQKVYIGYSKLKLHFRKFPDHYNYGEKTSEKQCQLEPQAELSNAETQTDLHSIDGGVDMAIQTSLFHLKSNGDININAGNALQSIGGDQECRTEMAPRFSFQSILGGSQSKEPVQSRNHKSQFSSHASTMSTSPVQSTSTFSGFRAGEFGRDALPNGHHNDPQTCPRNSPTFSQLLLNSPTSVSNGPDAHTGPLKSPVIPATPNRPNSNYHPTSELPLSGGTQQSQKLLWDIVEERMFHHGINEILAELSDVAEKLAKIARDKIIPIREEEEDQLRANNTAPIVLVETPFLSHLLDLPFGSYMFKEDAGIRRLPPPPVAAELSLNSLTSGVEVDIDKFLPGIDILHLPHLTNIDFSSICEDT